MRKFPIRVLKHLDAFLHRKDRFDIGIGENQGHEYLEVPGYRASVRRVLRTHQPRTGPEPNAVVAPVWRKCFTQRREDIRLAFGTFLSRKADDFAGWSKSRGKFYRFIESPSDADFRVVTL